MSRSEKKILYEKNLQVHEILEGKFFFGKYARNGLLGGEILKWKNEKIGKIVVILKIRQKKFKQKIGVRAPQLHPPIQSSWCHQIWNHYDHRYSL